MSPLGWLLAAGVVCGSLTAIIVFLKWLLPMFRKIGHLVDDFAGEPARDGVPARPGLMARVAKIETSVTTEVTERLNTLDRDYRQLDKDVQALAAKVDTHEDAVRAWTKEQSQVLGVIGDAIAATPPRPVTD